MNIEYSKEKHEKFSRFNEENANACIYEQQRKDFLKIKFGYIKNKLSKTLQIPTYDN